MNIILTLVIVEALATYTHARHRRLGSYDSYEWKHGVDLTSLPNKTTRFWWQDNAISTPWWIGTKSSENETAGIGTTEFSPVGNMTLTQQQVEELANGMHAGDLDLIIKEESVLVFNETKPELHRLVRKWLLELVNKTKMDKSFTLPWVDETPWPPHDADDQSSEFLANDENVNPLNQRYLKNGRTPPSFQTPGHQKEKSLWLKYRPEYRGPSRWPYDYQDGRSGSHPHQPRPQEVPSNAQRYPPGSQRLPSSFQGLPPGFERYPQGPQEARSGSQRYPLRPQEVPPYIQGYPPGSQRLPPGSQGYPPGSQRLPPGAQGFQPGLQGLPPGFEQYPLNPQDTPSVSKLHPPGLPPAYQSFPPEPGRQITQQASPGLATSSTSPTEPVPVMNRPDYADIMGNIDERPDLVNELANSVILSGLKKAEIQHTTTVHPLVGALKQDMVSSKRGYFSTFLTKLLEMLATKENDVVRRLLAANAMDLDEIDTELRFFGMPLQPMLLKASQVLATMAPDVVRSHAAMAHQALKFKTLIPEDVGGMLSTLDSVYLPQEGEALFAALTTLDQYPDSNQTSQHVMRTINAAMYAPFYRLQGTEYMNSVIAHMNAFLAGYAYPSRKSYAREYQDHHLNKDILRNANWASNKISKANSNEDKNSNAISANPKVKVLTNHGKKGKGTLKIVPEITRERNKKKKGGKYQTGTDETKNCLSKLKLSKESQNEKKGKNTNVERKAQSKNDGRVESEKTSGDKLKTKGLTMTIETDREFTINKHKPIDLKKHIKHKIRNHLKNKHRELFEDFRNKHKKAKSLAEQTYDSKRSGHNYETLLTNRFRYEDKPNTNVETRKHIDSSFQKRFNVVDSQIIQTNKKLVTNKTGRNKNSKHLSKLKPNNKTQRLDKSNIITKIGIDDSSCNEDEKDVKFNLQDTLRHGDRKYRQRRNHITRNRKHNLHDLSSYSDEEGVLKRNIYNVFGYTQGRI